MEWLRDVSVNGVTYSVFRLIGNPAYLIPEACKIIAIPAKDTTAWAGVDSESNLS